MNHRIALLVDFDNAQISASDEDFRNCADSSLWARPLVRAVEERCEGQVDVRRVYGNTLHHVQDMLRSREWNPKNLRHKMDLDVSIQYDLSRHGFQVIHCPTGQGRKNRADILMALDCMEIAANYGHIDTFAILSHDSDFSALIQRLRAIGKRVALVTVGKMDEERSRILTALANFQVTYDQQAIDACGPRVLQEVLEEIRQQPNEFSPQGLTADLLRTRIRQRLADFHHQDLGFVKISDFLTECIDGSAYKIHEGKVHLARPSRSGTDASQAKPQSGTALHPPSADAAEGQTAAKMPMTHEQKVRSCLTGRNFRFHAAIREIMLDHISQSLAAHATHGDECTFGMLQDEILSLHALSGHSKSILRDSLGVLMFSGVLQGERVEGGSLKKMVVTGCLGLDEARRLQAQLASRILDDNGIPVTASEIPILTELILGEDDPGRRSVMTGLLAEGN
jgi:hypothetical protein